MDLIYTNTRGVDLGILTAYELDLSFGVDENENDFELILGKHEPIIEDGAYIYIEGSEYGGIVGGMKSGSLLETRTSVGRTWHGVLDSKIIEPDPGADYLTVSGDAHDVLAALIPRLRLSSLFYARAVRSGIEIKNYRFARYVKGYAGIRAMLTASGAKLKMQWLNGRVELYVEPIVDYSAQTVDGDEAELTVERYGDKVNHLICLGAGELAARTVVHLYVDQFGRIGDTQSLTELAEIAATYEYTGLDDPAELRAAGIKRLEELRDNDKVTVKAYEGSGLEYDVGDVIGGTDNVSGNTAKAAVVQKIVKIQNGAVSVEYKTGA